MQTLKRLTSIGLALLIATSALPATAFAADSGGTTTGTGSTLADVTAKYIDAENGKEINIKANKGVVLACGGYENN